MISSTAAATNLSYVGTAALSLLNSSIYSTYESQLWELTSGQIIGNLQYTPSDFWNNNVDSDMMENRDEQLPLPAGHSNWFAEGLGELLGRTTFYCDVMSLAPPDDYFLLEMRKGISAIIENANGIDDEPIIVRMMFGDFDPTSPTNVTQILNDLIDGILPTTEEDSQNNIHIWIGAWRNKLTWNHAKLIAIDGTYLHTGGHNLWTSDYLQEAPVHDLSFEVAGGVTHSAHKFANEQWEYLQRNVLGGSFAYANSIEDFIPTNWQQYLPFIPGNDQLLALLPAVSNWFVASYANDGNTPTPSFPPPYAYNVDETNNVMNEDSVPMISMGKLGSILEDEPSEEAFVAMFDSSIISIKLAIQDIGPRKLCRDQPVPLIGFAWPTNHLQAFGRALVRGVDVSMILSNLGAFELGGYSNGWTCNDVAAQILQTIPIQYPDLFYSNTTNAAEDEAVALNKTRLLDLATNHLRIGFLRGKHGNQYSNGNEMALHSKHFIIDDIAAYIGSENICKLIRSFVCHFFCFQSFLSVREDLQRFVLFYQDSFDVAEWGILVDDETETKKMMDQIWNPMFNYSYTGEDCDLAYVVENLLEVPERTIQEDIDSMLECFDIDIDAIDAESLVPTLLNVLSGLGGGTTSSSTNETTMLTPPSSSPTTAITDEQMATSSPTTADPATSGDNEDTSKDDHSAATSFFNKRSEIRALVGFSLLGIVVSSLLFSLPV